MPQSTAAAAFFECPACGRQYTLKRGKALTFRWGHPVSLALYPAQMFPDPRGGEAAAAKDMMRGKSREEIAAMADEIVLELDQPSQRVRDILDCVAPEEICRAYLAGVVRALRAAG